MATQLLLYPPPKKVIFLTTCLHHLNKRLDVYLKSSVLIMGDLNAPWTQDVSWTYIRPLDDVFWMSYVHWIYVLCLGGRLLKTIWMVFTTWTVSKFCLRIGFASKNLTMRHELTCFLQINYNVLNTSEIFSLPQNGCRCHENSL